MAAPRDTIDETVSAVRRPRAADALVVAAAPAAAAAASEGLETTSTAWPHPLLSPPGQMAADDGAWVQRWERV